jgi:hypothetical protein
LLTIWSRIDIIDDFTLVDFLEEMPHSELCSFCNVRRYQMMQSTSYSVYDSKYQTEFEYINQACGLSLPTDIPEPLMVIDDPYEDTDEFCASDILYITQVGDTCDKIATEFKVASAALYMGNVNLRDCFSIPVGTKLCMPFSCEGIYTLKEGDTCISIEEELGIKNALGATIRRYNPWLDYDCLNLHEASDVAYGHVLCSVPQAGNSTTSPPGHSPTTPGDADGYVIPEIPPPSGIPVAEGTTYRCGKWHVVTNDQIEETCTTLCVQESIPWDLFLTVNPSLDAANCVLAEGYAYCAGPIYEWNTHFEGEEDALN